MINTKELMEGNLIRHIPSGNIKTVVFGGTLKADDYEPIPLSPEILEHGGFECKVENENILKFKYGTNPVTDDWILIIVHFKEQNIFFYRNGYHQLKYLHQLQNLFSILTHEQLPINSLSIILINFTPAKTK